MKSRSENSFSAIFLPRYARKTNCGKYLSFKFRVLSRVSRVMILGLAINILVVGRVGFSEILPETYPNRPTAAEMDEMVRLGTECARGVNERCWATQYQTTNPVPYRVAPFTNTAQWYLDQNLMGAMATNIRALVPWYVNPNTVSNGMTSITMLTVPGVWAQLRIGDHINQFTCTPAIGTNPAIYGDSPWRIYKLDLEERYKVLEALKISSYRVPVDLTGVSAQWTSTYVGLPNHFHSGWDDFADLIRYATSRWADVQTRYAAIFEPRPSDTFPGYYWLAPPRSKILAVRHIRACNNAYWTIYPESLNARLRLWSLPTNDAYSLIVTACSVKVSLGDWWGYQCLSAISGVYTNEFSSQGAFGAENEWATIYKVTNSFFASHETAIFGSYALPEWPVDPTTRTNLACIKGNKTEWGFKASYDKKFLTNFFPSQRTWLSTNIWPDGFQYCTNIFW